MHAHQLFAALAAVSLSHAHMFILSPTPIEGTDSKSPLAADGSQFPCQGATLPTSGGQPMAAGSQQNLSFALDNGQNTAVHGGGSCQISITYETDPAKQKDPANWKVIYSIEGGCPSDTRGNLPEGQAVDCTPGSSDPDCVNVFPFTIPKGVKDGHAILAWTWVNTIGNREYYMNCANVEISGGDSSEMATFPELFVANQAGISECPTTEQVNVAFPNPGKYVITHTQGNPYPLATPTGQGCSAAGAPAASTSDAQPTASSGMPSASTVAPGPSSALAAQLGATDAPAPSSAASTIASAAATTPSAPSAPALPPSAGGSGNCPSSQVPCQNPGALLCIGASQFGICDQTNCAIPQQLAAGTTCSNGAIMRKRRIARGQAGQDRI